jgi:hypothetical protein
VNAQTGLKVVQKRSRRDAASDENGKRQVATGGVAGERQYLVHVIKADDLLPFLIIEDPATSSYSRGYWAR